MTDLTGTMSDRAFVGRIAEEVKAARPVALCSVLATKGSTPRHAGARMAVLQAGECLGTIGGGRIEQMGKELCSRLMATGETDVAAVECADADEAVFGETAREGVLAAEMSASRRVPDNAKSRGMLSWVESRTLAMLCGGAALIAVRLLGPDDLGVLDALCAEGSSGGELREDWSCAAAPRWRVLARGGGGVAENLVGPTWDDNASLYREPLQAQGRVFVFGAGHVSAALVPILSSVGFCVTVFEQRPEFAVVDRFLCAEQVVCCDYREMDRYATVSGDDYVVVITHEHALDVEVLAWAVARNPRYVGGMGSLRKAARVRELLTARGLDGDLVAQAHMPIGLNIAAETPAEIAVSIAAEMIRVRASG